MAGEESTWMRVSPSVAAFEREYPGADALSTELVINLVRVGDQLTAKVHDWVRARGLPSASALVAMEVLRGAEGPLRPSELAERMFVSRGTVTGLLDTLERRGLARRLTNAADRRTVLVEATPEGRALMDDLVPDLHRAEKEWLRSVPAATKREVLAALGWILAVL